MHRNPDIHQNSPKNVKKSAAFCGKRGVDLGAAMVREQLLSNAAVREEEQRETPAAPPETRPALRARPRMGRYKLSGQMARARMGKG